MQQRAAKERGIQSRSTWGGRTDWHFFPFCHLAATIWNHAHTEHLFGKQFLMEWWGHRGQPQMGLVEVVRIWGGRADTAEGEHLKEYCSNRINTSTKRDSLLVPVDVSFLINFEMLADSKPCLNIDSKSSIQESPKDSQNCPYPGSQYPVLGVRTSLKTRIVGVVRFGDFSSKTF